MRRLTDLRLALGAPKGVLTDRRYPADGSPPLVVEHASCGAPGRIARVCDEGR